MTASPAILALITVTLLLAAYACYAANAGLRILIGWRDGCCSGAQLLRERKTGLLSILLRFILLAELLCLVVFVTLADRLHPFFTGAMCATGTLNANACGYPALLVLMAGFVLAILWLCVDALDAFQPNLRVLRVKYLSLVPLAVLLGAQAALILSYFWQLNPSLITSCCGTFFDGSEPGVGSEVAHLPSGRMQWLFWSCWLVTLAVGWRARRVPAFDAPYAVLSGLMLPLGLAAIVSFISVGIYQLPTHHCPFCLLQREYGHLGYLLYPGLLLGAAFGMGAGLVRACGRYAALADRARPTARRLNTYSLTGYALFGVLAARPHLPTYLFP